MKKSPEILSATKSGGSAEEWSRRRCRREVASCWESGRHGHTFPLTRKIRPLTSRLSLHAPDPWSIG